MTVPHPKLQQLIQTDPDLVDRIFDYILQELPSLKPRMAEMKAEVRAEFQGEECYIPMRGATDRQQRVQQVLALFNGRNASDVARRLQISRSTVYRLLKQPGTVKKLSQFS